MIHDYIYSKIETIPEEDINALLLNKLNTLINIATNSPFYKERIPFTEISDLSELENIPILTKNDLYSHSNLNNLLLTENLSDAAVYKSGGTTGRPKFTIYSNKEFEYFSDVFARTYFTAGLRKEDKVANLFFCGDLYPSFIFVHKLIQKIGCLNFPIVGTTSIERVIEYLKVFGINAILGPTSYILSLIKRISEYQISNEVIPLDKILYAGEPLYKTDEQYIREVLNSDITIKSAGYGCTDLGLMGYQCLTQSESIHHILFDHVYIEIVDPITKRPVKDGQEGDILVTNLDKTMMPFIRFDIGDKGVKLNNPCSCGRTGKLLKILGRNDDIIRVGYTNISHDDIVNAISTIKPFTSNIQIIKNRRHDITLLEVKIECDEEWSNEKLISIVYEKMFLLYPYLKSEMDKGIIDIKITLLPQGSLLRNPRTGKITHIVDNSRDNRGGVHN